MTRKTLEGLGVPGDIVGDVLNALHAEINTHKDANDKLQQQIAELSKTVNTYESEKSKYDEQVKDMQAKLDAELAAHKQTRESYEAEKTAATIDAKVMALLKAGNDTLGTMNEAVIPKALKLYDRSIVQLDKNGEIKDPAKVLDVFAGEWKEFFAKTEQKPAPIGTPPGPNNENTNVNFTRELFGIKS